MRLQSGTTDQYIYFIGANSVNAIARATGLTGFTVHYSRDGGATVQFTTPTVNETDITNMPGVYELLLDEGTTMTAGNITEELCLHIEATGMLPVTRVIELYGNEPSNLKAIGDSTGAADKFKAGVDVIITGTFSGTPTTTSGETSITGFTQSQLVNRPLYITSGAANGEVTVVTSYEVTGSVLGFNNPELTLAPSSGDSFYLG